MTDDQRLSFSENLLGLNGKQVVLGCGGSLSLGWNGGGACVAVSTVELLVVVVVVAAAYFNYIYFQVEVCTTYARAMDSFFEVSTCEPLIVQFQ